MTLHWTEEGPADAPVLVLLNAVGTSTQMWEPCVGPLAEQFRVLRVDTRGHGESAPNHDPCSIADLGRDVLGVLDAAGVRRAQVAGLSLGGMIGMWLGVHAPHRVARLALLCTSAWLAPGQLYLDRAAAVRDGGIEPIAEAVVARWVTPGLAAHDPDLLAELQAMLCSVDAESYARCCEAIAAMDQRADLPRIAAPTLVVVGAEDVATPLRHGEVMASGIPAARLTVIPGAAHVATVETPGAVAEALLGHFAGGSLATGYAVRRAVLGDEYVDTAVGSTTDLSAEFQALLTRYAWGSVWSRPGLGRRERSIVTLTALITLGAEPELAAHLRGAVRNGLTHAEIAEVITHAAVYAGMPRANRAMAIAAEVLGSASPPG